jgi:hypothetical protein
MDSTRFKSFLKAHLAQRDAHYFVVPLSLHLCVAATSRLRRGEQAEGSVMEELIARVSKAAEIDRGTAKTAIGHVLLFMRDQAPESRVAELIDNMPLAHEAVEAAAAASDGGVTAVIGGLTDFMGFGQASLDILAGKLNNLGLNEMQSQAVLKEIFAHADEFVGEDGVAKMAAAMPYLSQFIRKTASDEAARRSL